MHRLPAFLLAVAGVLQPLPPEAQLPDWARTRWNTVARSSSLILSQRINPFLQRGDFDGDGRLDLALLVEHATSHKVGIVFLHRGSATPFVIGAGTTFGNGGDDFAWMDIWIVQDRARQRTDELLLVKESSASAAVFFANGRYHWKQQGD